jgi:hypothetical protein
VQVSRYHEGKRDNRGEGEEESAAGEGGADACGDIPVQRGGARAVTTLRPSAPLDRSRMRGIATATATLGSVIGMNDKPATNGDQP